MRASWDDVWIEMAFAVAKRSLCVRSRVGSVIVSTDNRVVSVGYNGPPSGLNVIDVCEKWCPHAMAVELGVGHSYALSCTIHAEVNAIMRGDWVRMQGGTLYTTRTPCNDCAKIIANSGINRAVFPIQPHDQRFEPNKIVDFLLNCGVSVAALNHEVYGGTT